MGKQKEASPVGQTVKNPPAIRKTLVWSLGQEDPLEKGMATHFNILAWRITYSVKHSLTFFLWELKDENAMKVMVSMPQIPLRTTRYLHMLRHVSGFLDSCSLTLKKDNHETVTFQVSKCKWQHWKSPFLVSELRLLTWVIEWLQSGPSDLLASLLTPSQHFDWFTGSYFRHFSLLCSNRFPLLSASSGL